MGQPRLEINEGVNSYYGGSGYFIGTQIGTKKNGTQSSLTLLYTKNFSSDAKVAEGPEVSLGSNSELEVKLDFLYKLSENSFLGLTGGGDFITERNSSNEVVAPDVASFRGMELGVQYQYQFKKGLVGRTSATHLSADWNTGTVDFDIGWVYKLGLSYEFE